MQIFLTKKEKLYAKLGILGIFICVLTDRKSGIVPHTPHSYMKSGFIGV